MKAPYRVSFLIEDTGHRAMGVGPLSEHTVRECLEELASPDNTSAVLCYAKISEIEFAEDADHRDWEALTETNASLVDANARLVAAAAELKSVVGRFLAGQLDNRIAAKTEPKKSVTVLMNGRRRGAVMLASTASEAEARVEVSEPQYGLHDCREPGKNGVRKFLYVPGKVINIILDEPAKTSESWAESRVDETIDDVTQSEAFCCAMVNTRAVACHVDEHEIVAARPPLTNGPEHRRGVWVLAVRYSASPVDTGVCNSWSFGVTPLGEQSEDRIRGSAEALVYFDGSVEYRDVTAEVESME